LMSGFIASLTWLKFGMWNICSLSSLHGWGTYLHRLSCSQKPGCARLCLHSVAVKRTPVLSRWLHRFHITNTENATFPLHPFDTHIKAVPVEDEFYQLLF
jgi:hypothetical protein